MDNGTSIKNDKSFLEELDKTLSIYNEKMTNSKLGVAEVNVLNYLILLSEICNGKIPLKGKQEKYISIQRLLSDDPEILLSDKVGDLSNYFSFSYKLPQIDLICNEDSRGQH